MGEETKFAMADLNAPKNSQSDAIFRKSFSHPPWGGRKKQIRWMGGNKRMDARQIVRDVPGRSMGV
jgi:hypothetical protein